MKPRPALLSGALDIPCPVCPAPAGVPCRWREAGGYPARWYHNQRRVAAGMAPYKGGKRRAAPCD